MSDLFFNAEYEVGDTENLIAVNDPEEGMTYVFAYGPDGAVAVW